MGKFIDKTGWIMKEHGVPDSRLTVLYRAENQGNKIFWHVKCECGNEFDVRGDSLTKNTLSCGCLHHERFKTKGKDISNQKFGLLTAIKPVQNKNNKIIWECKCDCGNITYASTSDLNCGHTKSCGCLHTYNNKDNLKGKTFGKLTVIEYAGSDNGKRALYSCICECGSKIIVRADSLRRGMTTSCGCIKSIGENNIIKILKDNNINYIHDEAYFKDLINPLTNRILRYDFVLIKNNKPYRIIEFDGEQHQVGWSRDENDCKEIQQRDNIKNQYALSHNIPLVRIPYTERDKITIDLLMSDKYLVR